MQLPRYIKAIDELKKVRKVISETARSAELEAGFLLANKNKWKELQTLKQNSEQKMVDISYRKETLDDQRQVSEDRLAAISEQLKEINRIAAKRDALSTKIDEKKHAIQQMKNSLQSCGGMFDGTDDELNDLIENHDVISAKRKKTVNELSNQLNDDNKKIERLSEEIDRKKSELNNLKTELALHEKDCTNRDHLISQLARDFNLSGFEVPLDQDDRSRFKALMTDKLRELGRKKENEKNRYSREEKEAQEKIDKFMLDLAQCDEAIKRESDDLNQAKNIKMQSEKQLNDIQRSASKILNLKSQVEKSKRKQEEHEQSMDINDMDRKRENFKSKVDANEQKLKHLSDELNESYKNLALVESITNLKAAIKSKEKSNDTIISKREDDLITILDCLPEKELKAKITKALEMKTAELANASKVFNEKHLKLQSLKFQKTATSEKLNKINSEKMKIEGEIEVGEDFEKQMEKVNQEMKEIQDKIGYLKGSSAVYSHYCAKLKEKSPKCPVCFRGFEAGSGASARESADRLQELKNRVPSSLKTEEQKLKTKETQLKKLYDSKHLYAKYEDITQEIPELRKQIEIDSLEIASLAREVEDEQQKKDFVQSDVTMLQDSIADASEWDRNQRDLVDLKESLKSEEIKLNYTGSLKGTKEIEAEKNKIEKFLKTVKEDLEEVVSKIDSFTKAKAKLHEETLRLEQDLVELSSTNQRADQISEKVKELEQKCVQLAESVRANRAKVSPLREKLESAKVEKANLVREKERVLNKLTDEDSNCAAKLKQISEIASKINSFDFDQKKATFDDTESQVGENEIQLKKSKVRLSEGQSKVDRLKSEVANEAMQRRAYDDNLNLRLAMQEKSKLHQELTDVDKSMGRTGKTGGSLQREYEQLLQEGERVTREFHQTDGQLRELKSTLATLDKQLNDKIYSEASHQWIRKVAEWKSNKLACADLDKFGKALDSALMRFHSVKMGEINQVLSELWREVYTGRDIDCIEIRTEEGENSSHTRKTYNYRVVMLKEGVELDMRGRCSAGQKVLASLLIRLALAETFCLQCGVFSLDEPTTNLDRENIASLAEALVRIIRNRHHPHSQFVIITHDMDFVELLGNAELVEHYHEVSRDEFTGLSLIQRKSVREMDSNN
ncbi:DNA repair protein RAD50-like isoform X3 [Symsagittifera roscoffensis]|uniref:DNA repair protein RAD50-like isoform X3 n=1 Tax=Symsagittifera roscoffensis TaxID=84072 RepID=UPI00307C0F2E